MLRAQAEFAEEEAVVLMYACPAHVRPEIIGILTIARVRVVISVRHTMDIFSVLHLTLF
jgi:hypothetical protein